MMLYAGLDLRRARIRRAPLSTPPLLVFCFFAATFGLAHCKEVDDVDRVSVEDILAVPEVESLAPEIPAPEPQPDSPTTTAPPTEILVPTTQAPPPPLPPTT